MFDEDLLGIWICSPESPRGPGNSLEHMAFFPSEPASNTNLWASFHLLQPEVDFEGILGELTIGILKGWREMKPTYCKSIYLNTGGTTTTDNTHELKQITLEYMWDGFVIDHQFGLYRNAGDQLEFVFAEAGDPRPKKFAGYTIYSYQRINSLESYLPSKLSTS